MCIRPENRPEVDYRLVIVKRGGNLGRTARLRVVTADGAEYTMRTWDWPTGRPTAAQATDMVANLAAEVEADLVTRYGFQGVLGMG